ncbi:UvrB/UvrC motif-containing protein [Coraliomargarita sp. SDUM461004]|uniref:UvrB/UvrC motif-containing protein n=1 Tax=Thalassobacterium sedimentorum TaxID=3041258 RepID=A0ABU1AM41_9BACT|nr:UvrB/UvrC motif-containing protein [Coraliomargarita sp. SDUM461004]MDQ8195739.1 UvrB/UvrC motif-containing protein [Coraliomargarita sp. SDUM461004]
MAENLKCSHCSNPATVHLTQIVNNKIIKVDLCESCAQAKGVTDPEGFSLADLLSKTHLTPEGGEPQITCTACGLTTADFRRTGRLGCAACYTSFIPLVRPVLEDMHAGTVHKGKVPEVAYSRQTSAAQLQDLEEALQRAISEEAYEDAAKYRDQIQAIKEAVDAEAVQS